MKTLKHIINALRSFFMATGEVTYQDLYPACPKAKSKTGIVPYADYFRHDLHTRRSY
jgi:hypothetical protein